MMGRFLMGASLALVPALVVLALMSGSMAFSGKVGSEGIALMARLGPVHLQLQVLSLQGVGL
ncbi:hypothetical protein [Chromobacterium sp. IIBBL 290-4]|uniref:hypothetical protein n=1 Tax=Chromobacterium sp. IIBBL 290-4 TaxID=2953890 RepID=UPI0020B7B42C|nr:hypothetical protein [Chromobacterium sp. IIBBL 290-4]UTH75038.1 hypothetical protein NKT35_02730 [Chromobacterium sp. IIBBL 290-4]